MKTIVGNPFGAVALAALGYSLASAITMLIFYLTSLRRAGESVMTTTPNLLTFIAQCFFIAFCTLRFLSDYLEDAERAAFLPLGFVFSLMFHGSYFLVTVNAVIRFRRMDAVIMKSKLKLILLLGITASLCVCAIIGGSFLAFNAAWNGMLVGIYLLWLVIIHAFIHIKMISGTLNALKTEITIENAMNGKVNHVELDVIQFKQRLIMVFLIIMGIDVVCIGLFLVSITVKSLAADVSQSILLMAVSTAALHVMAASILMSSFRHKLRETLLNENTRKALSSSQSTMTRSISTKYVSTLDSEGFHYKNASNQTII